MEATALSVGKSVLNGALGYAKSAFAEEVALQLGIQKDHTFVADELEMMRSFMMEAHEERDNNKVVNTWVKQVRDTAYDVEDSLQDFAVRLKRPSWWRFPRTMLGRRHIAMQMKELRAKVEVVSQRNTRYHLIKGSGSKATTTSAEQSSATAAAIFGVDDARHASKQMNQRLVDLVQLISMDEEDPKVIAVWGTSGDIGVASTIMEAYENQEVQGKFSGRAWVRVMHPFSPRGFVESLVTEFQAAEGVEALLEIEEAKQELVKKFNEYVNKNRCLIVLNDLSTIEEWNQIKKCFQNIKKGSRTIVSTMQVEVASLCAGQESQASELKRLSHDQTLYAFYKKGSREDSHSLNTVPNREAATACIENPVPVEIEGDQSIALKESKLSGRKNEIDDVVKLLISRNSQQVEVISVWGMGGLGKTALVSSVYKSPKLSDKFEKFAFVAIMHPFNLAELLEIMVFQLDQGSSPKEQLRFDSSTGTKKSLPTISGLIEELKKHLNMKSCLIVLDDVSSISEWDQISPCLVPHLKETSRIIVTTRENDIAEHCSSGKQDNVYNLKVPYPDDAMLLCRKQAKGCSGKSVSISDVATSTGIPAHGEIIDYQSMDANKKKAARKSLTRIKTCMGALEESQLIGRKKEMSKIIDLISNNENGQQVQVISVWGMGGLGKTTLVRGVYHSPKLSDKFEKYVFITIMRPFNLKELLRTLVEQLLDESSKKEELLENRISSKKSLALMDVDKLTKELRRLLEKRSYLIVLDDFFETSEWDLIKPKLIPLLEKKSRIIVTTRKENIANHCSEKHGVVHNLQVLRPDDALCLLSEKVFDDAKYLDEQKDPNLLKEAKQILKKCGGLPLAIVVIGGLLANRPKTAQEWRQLNENINAEIEMNPELGMIRTVLEKSYDGLPYHLKSCFLYLSIFPEDENISRRRLVHRWAAEGYSSETHGKSAIEIADDYFIELKKRSMILPYQQSVHSWKSIDSCKVHDLMRDIAISKSMEENLVFRFDASSSNIHGAIRHLAISSNWEGDESEFESIVDLSRIRSLSLFGKWRPFFISDKMRFLRVLDFEGTNVDLKYHHLDQIWKLVHLKFLSLRGCLGIDLLPDTLGKLRQLQTLDIRGTWVKALPKTIIKLKKLQYIHVGRKFDYVEKEEENSIMVRCLRGARMGAKCCLPILMDIDGPLHKALTRRDACTFACCVAFPAHMTGVQEMPAAIVPRGIRKLKHLHTLRELYVGRGNAILHDIGMLTGLRKLGVAGINKNNGRAFCLAISYLKKLESLSVRSARLTGLHCLDEISSPPENLRSLKLYGNLKTMPEWMKQLQHLVKFKLVGLLKSNATLEFLGNLPSLEILVLPLSWSSSQCEELDFKSSQGGISFGNLRVLTVEVTGNIKSVKFDEGAMPKLERLEVTVTWAVSEIDFSGLAFLPNINAVLVRVSFTVDWGRINAAPDRETLDKIREEERQEQRRKQGELKKKIQEQLAQNTNEPIVTVDGYN